MKKKFSNKQKWTIKRNWLLGGILGMIKRLTKERHTITNIIGLENLDLLLNSIRNLEKISTMIRDSSYGGD